MSAGLNRRVEVSFDGEPITEAQLLGAGNGQEATSAVPEVEDPSKV